MTIFKSTIIAKSVNIDANTHEFVLVCGNNTSISRSLQPTMWKHVRAVRRALGWRNSSLFNVEDKKYPELGIYSTTMRMVRID